ncbi:rRNA maturation RNase YbeY [bacterium]|nr:rRNA maturation RNase YbeY [bacterium]MBU1985268.1 rRNA maturation RNase YbeY [bacterium]
MELFSQIPGARVRRDYLLACVRHGTRHIESGIRHVNIVLVDDDEMARLHRRYTGVGGTTDVLTFDLTDGRKSPVEGDIFICLDQARRQARELRLPIYQEVARLAVHGVLHLAGYRDRTETERQRMRRLEERSLAAGRHA